MTKKKANTNGKPRKPVRPKRKRGRPKKGQPVMTPEKLEIIARSWLRGKSYRAIAAEIGVDHKTVAFYLNSQIKPEWKDELNSELHVEMAKVAQIEQVAWECFGNSQGDETRETVKERLIEETNNLELAEKITSKLKREGSTAWIVVIQWCIDWRAKVAGTYSATRLDVADYRVAGKGTADIDKEMMDRLAGLVTERNKFDPSAN
jgi:predicted transcriptional regulator